ncbi:MAG: polysaccharide biosynthesis tyrosine autokinase [Verrucomicrobiae bacterium]|nr:polysaccharide biosynthesis tyrosine autokinase [Verrucomicrobiae bacterium]
MSLINTEEDTPVLGIMDYLRIIRERWLLGLALAILLAGVWTLYQMSRKPLYTSSVQMLVEILDDKVVDMEQVKDEQDFIARSARADSLLNQHLIKMLSREFREYVIDSLTQSQINRILNPYRSAELATPNLNRILADAVSIDIDGKALVYNLSATHRDPEVAALIADTFVQQYIRYILSDVGSSNDTAISFLEVKARDLESIIKRKESELQAFRKEHKIVSIEESKQLTLSQLQQHQGEQTRLNIELQGLEAVTTQINNAGSDLDELLKIPELAQYGNVASYKRDRDLAVTQREQLSIDLLERHPRMVENESTIKEYTGLLQAELNRAVRSLEARAEKIKAQQASNDDKIARYQSDVQRLEELAIEYQSMVRSIEGEKHTLLEISDRLNETQIASQLSNANMRIIDSAAIPGKPSSPDMKKTVMVAVALFMIGLVGLPIGLNFLDNKMKTPWDVEGYLKKPLLGEIFRLGKEEVKQIGKLVQEGKDELLVDTFRSVYNLVKLNDTVHSDKKIQIVTSTIPDEGKTMFSMNYGAVIAQHGAKTLLIDCDLRKPRMEKYLDLKTEKGLVYWLTSDESVPNGNLMNSSLGICQLDANTFLLPAGKATHRSTELVESPRFRALIERLGEEYDHIIIDTPPIAVFPDAMFLAEYAQEVIYVSSYNRVSRNTVKHFVDQLDKTKARVCGIVLNGRKHARSGGPFGYNYGYNYKYAKKYYGKYYSKNDEA